MPVAILLLAALQAAPSVRDHFPDEGAPTHSLLVVEAASGKVVRAESGSEDPAVPHPWDGLGVLLAALTGLEEGNLTADRTVRCDSTCWAAGGHGETALVEGLAWACGAWTAALARSVPADRVQARARTLGMSAEDAATLEQTSVEACVAFWRRLSSSSLRLDATTAAPLLAVAGVSVSSPRGAGRILHDPRHRTRAFVAGGPTGAWVIGSRDVMGRPWAFALYLPGGTPQLAASRAARLLEETRRVARAATSERGGLPSEETED